MRPGTPAILVASAASAGCLAVVLVVAASTGDLLLAEAFDSPESLALWTPAVGATTGDGPSSDIAWDDGALRLSGDETTRVWMAPTREIEVPGAGWLEIHARIRTDAVDPVLDTYVNCNLYLLYPGGIDGTRVVLGTTDWTEVRRRIELPDDTRRVTLGALLSMPGRAWFDDIRVESVPAPEWTEALDGHYRYMTLPGDEIPAGARAYNAESFRIVGEFLGVAEPDPVTYFKYPDLDTLEAFTGFRGNAVRRGQVIHSIWPSDRHEIVHVMADVWGDPPALLAEGLAVSLSGAWQGEDIRLYAARMAARGEWIPPSEILGSAEFRALPDIRTYAVAGAFASWLIETYGRDTVRALCGALENQASRDVNARRLEEILGMPLDELDEGLLDWVQGSR